MTGCAHRADDGPVVVDVIGGTPALADPSRRSLDPAARILAGAVAQGLVRFDAAGQIEPGIAERWTVIENGRSYIFRLRDARWANGRAVTAAEVVDSLRRAVAPGTRNPLAPWLSAVGAIVEMTPEVIEIDLSRPRPDLLKLFAQPELAVVNPHEVVGSGPFRATPDRNGVRLRPAPDPQAQGDDDAPRPGPADEVGLSARTAAQAVVRFTAHRSDLVLGGTFADWPLLAAAGIAPANVRTDPAAGLFGLAIASRDGFLADPANRAALSAIFDRNALAAALAMTPSEQVVSETLDAAAPPLVPGWTALAVEDRQAAARGRVAEWQRDHPGPVAIRIALPAGPGANLLWGNLGAALIASGFSPSRVAAGTPAELRLVDAVAPYDSARWYLATACRPCGTDASAALDAARQAPTPAARAQALSTADAAVVADTPFIPLARPLRWSLVALRITQWQPNARAWHPLNHLRGPTI